MFLAHRHIGEVLNAFTRLFLEPNFVTNEKKPKKTKIPLISGPRLGGQVSRPWRSLGPPWPASHPHPQMLTSQQAALDVEGHPERHKQPGGCLGKAWPTNGVSSCVGAGLPVHVFPHTGLLVPVCLAAWAGSRVQSSACYCTHSPRRLMWEASSGPSSDPCAEPSIRTFLLWYLSCKKSLFSGAVIQNPFAPHH